MLAVRRGAVGALASGDARVRRACGAVLKGARAEAGWRRAPRARAEGFMGVRLRIGSQVGADYDPKQFQLLLVRISQVISGVGNGSPVEGSG